MTWERCGNLPYYRKTIGRNTIYTNPFNWSQVFVAAERHDEWAGIAVITYRKTSYDWDVLKLGVLQYTPVENKQNTLRATHEWAVDRMKAQADTSPNASAKIMKLFQEGSEEARGYVLEGVGAMIQASSNQKVVTLIAIEKDSPAYRDIKDLREVFDHAAKFFIAQTLDAAIQEGLDYLGIYEC